MFHARVVTNSDGKRSIRAGNSLPLDQKKVAPKLPKCVLAKINMSREATLSELFKENRYNLLAFRLLTENFKPNTKVSCGYTNFVVAIDLGSGICYRAKGAEVFLYTEA